MASDSTEPRETSGATTNLLLRYVRELGGEQAVAEMLALSGVPHTVTSLQDTSTWVSYDTRLRLFEAATTVLKDPRTAFEVGATGLRHGVHPAIVPLLRAFGSPREVFRQLPLTVPKFTTTSTMDAVESTETSATIRYRLHAGFAPSRLDCEYAQGLFSAVPCMFGLPRAQVEHHECASDGYPACLYRVTWTARRRWYSVIGRRRADQVAVAALHAQLAEFQQAAADLVSSSDIDEVLDRIVGRAAAAILAPSYLLVVYAAGGSEPVVRHQGLDPAVEPVLLLGEGTFHQLHYGATTQADGVRRKVAEDGATLWDRYMDEYHAIVGEERRLPAEPHLLLGRVRSPATRRFFFPEL